MGNIKQIFPDPNDRKLWDSIPSYDPIKKEWKSDFDSDDQWEPLDKAKVRKILRKERKVKGRVISEKEEAFQAMLKKMDEEEEDEPNN